ncbi:MAG TPA: hypothetical protein VFP61_14310 [Acidimicrobiales bacterium]|nr:hypothetical protein [Acidimicrobiales bacterium]
MAEETGWNPWRALRERKHLTLEWRELDSADALLVDAGGGRRRVILDWRLGRRARSAALTHELVHDERGLLYDLSTPGPLVAKEEAAVRAETARRLVPPERLDALAESGTPVELWEVADRFDVPEDIARQAIERWRQDRLAALRTSPEKPAGGCQNGCQIPPPNAT